VWHYGSRSSVRGGHPRYSLAVEFMSGAVSPFNIPTSHPLVIPEFADRMKLIAKQIHQYKHMYNIRDIDIAFANLINSTFHA
jgi:hypothetical protein